MSGHEFPLHVEPRLPERLGRLGELAANLWFSWHRPTRHLFEMLDRDLWWRTERNPRVFLRCVDQGLLELAATNDTFLAAYRRALSEFDSYREQGTGAFRAAGLGEDDLIAYFCAEFGFHESFPIYSGGLGILAGDHCKTASDLRLPFVAVGLLYRRGYFSQRIGNEGQQIADDARVTPEDAPVSPALDAAGNEIIVGLRLAGRDVAVRVWRAEVGRVPLLLLDTDLPQNDPDDREITRQLYGGDSRTRLRQESVLGIAGVRALRAAGFEPRVWHINEGHAAFQIVERVRELVASGQPFDAAMEAVAGSTVFTTHTPVSAGHDVFDPHLLFEHLSEFVAGLGVSAEHFVDIAREHPGHGGFNMTRLALAGSRHVNGVSRIHRQVTSGICSGAWPEVDRAENPVGYVTNGVHVPTFMQTEWAELLDQHLGPGWRYQLSDRELMARIEDIPDGRFWYVRQQVKISMLQGLRERLRRQHGRNEQSAAHIHRLLKYLDPDRPNILTVGFARRFATYKRATLLLQDLGWLRQIVDGEDRPVVFIFAGKAHPADHPGQQLLRELHRVANLPEFLGKLLLVEGYDMGLGRLLTSGVDVWLNTPVHPMEASGTSGMKAAINGTVNLSVLDGWWAEGYDGSNGWVIPPSLLDADPGARDHHDARTLYEILQDEVVPLYYARDERLGYSPGWVRICKRSMATILPHFNMQRAVQDYATLFYGPAARRGVALSANGLERARVLAGWKARVRAAWPGVVLRPVTSVPPRADFSAPVTLEVDVHLNGLAPADVQLECVVRRTLCSELTAPVRQFADRGGDGYGVRYVDGEPVYVQPFTPQAPGADGWCRYRLELRSPWCGGQRVQVRAVPRHADLQHAAELGLMRWLDASVTPGPG
jgi:starch phosphorylase